MGEDDTVCDVHGTLMSLPLSFEINTPNLLSHAGRSREILLLNGLSRLRCETTNSGAGCTLCPMVDMPVHIYMEGEDALLEDMISLQSHIELSATEAR